MTEPIFIDAPFACAHASTIVELANGDLLAAWFAGSSEGEKDVAIFASRRSNGSWGPLVELVREPVACYNPVLFHTHDGRLHLYYKFGTHPVSWTAGRLSSDDEGLTWTATEHLAAGLYGPVRTKPLVLDNGVIVSGTSVETYRSWACWIERSTDHGATWTKIGPISVPRQLAGDGVCGDAPPAVPGSEEWRFTQGIIQPSVVSLGPKHLRLYARSTSLIGKICAADSFDAGLTWTQAHPIDVPNPNSGIDAVALRDGRVVLIYNHTNTGRSPLNLAMSTDSEHFQMFHVLEDQPGEYSYPAMVQARDGDLLITYTSMRRRIQYVRFPLSLVRTDS